ncbi:MAG: PipX family protein [Geminocystis sp.]|nr:PipX family protein [Geminocystis sp.]HIK36704.1 PipX family protein [Geminocystis sp. M7585_C2015_104]MCS7146783.1 PipX family protein [Geminocystis sp.]MCX8077067.1 PipX family protein [Geminocystis sp.]MDW8115609.1 PipX family protein [Geminocystis sp.]
MVAEVYINHPNFGLLYRLCVIDRNEELYTTLYAQRLFFRVTSKGNSISFEPVSRNEARMLMENRLRHLKNSGEWEAYQQANKLYQAAFQ